MSDAQMMVGLMTAGTVAVAVIRYWRLIIAFIVAVFVGLFVIGLLTVISWTQTLPHP